MSATFKLRQVEKYDGQSVFANGKIAYDLGNYLGGGASGSVYQAIDTSCQDQEKYVAIKILNPLGYKNIVFGNINQCSVASKGAPLTTEQASGRSPMVSDNVWWLLHPTTKVLFAAFEDPMRRQMREIPLTKCIEIWGMNPLNLESLTETELEKANQSAVWVTLENKEYRLPLVSPKFLKFLRNRQHVCREMNNMVRIGEHPNIVELLEVLELVQDTKTTLFLVLELINGGELFDRVKAGVTGNVEDFARRYFNQMLSGLEFCHKRGVAHRDLKPENLLLSDPSDQATLKIADFGLSAVMFAAEASSDLDSASSNNNINRNGQQSNSDQLSPTSRIAAPLRKSFANVGAVNGNGSMFYTPMKSTTPPPPPNDLSPASFRRLKSVVGSPHYIAPEIAMDDPSGYDGRKVDMWSSGVILYSLFTGSLPFGSDLAVCSRFKRYKLWLTTEYAAACRDGKEPVLPHWFWPSSISPVVTPLLIGLLHCDPQQRLSAAEALNHPWSRGLSAEEARANSQALMPQRLFNEPTTITISTPMPVTGPAGGSVLPAPVPKSYLLPRAVPPSAWRFGGSRQPTPDLTTIREDEIAAMMNASRPPAIPFIPSNAVSGQIDSSLGWESAMHRSKEAEVDAYTRQVGNMRLSGSEGCDDTFQTNLFQQQQQQQLYQLQQAQLHQRRRQSASPHCANDV